MQKQKESFFTGLLGILLMIILEAEEIMHTIAIFVS
jgi:hypothetical protein